MKVEEYAGRLGDSRDCAVSHACPAEGVNLGGLHRWRVPVVPVYSESIRSAFSLVLLRNVCDLGANAEALFSATHRMSSSGVSKSVVYDFQRADTVARVSA